MINVEDYNEMTQGKWKVRKTTDDVGDYTRYYYDVLTVIESIHGNFNRVICSTIDNPTDAYLIANAPDILQELIEAKIEIEELKTKIDDLCGL